MALQLLLVLGPWALGRPLASRFLSVTAAPRGPLSFSCVTRSSTSTDRKPLPVDFRNTMLVQTATAEKWLASRTNVAVPLWLQHPPLPVPPASLVATVPCLQATIFDRQVEGGFVQHVEQVHNIWQYLYFLIYLKQKSEDEFTGQESYVSSKLKLKDVSFFPLRKSMDLVVAKGPQTMADRLLPHIKAVAATAAPSGMGRQASEGTKKFRDLVLRAANAAGKDLNNQQTPTSQVTASPLQRAATELFGMQCRAGDLRWFHPDAPSGALWCRIFMTRGLLATDGGPPVRCCWLLCSPKWGPLRGEKVGRKGGPALDGPRWPCGRGLPLGDSRPGIVRRPRMR